MSNHMIVDGPVLSRKQQRELHERAKDGDDAAHKALWLQGVRMVKKLVTKMVQIERVPGEQFEDALQEGYLAVGEALSEWDPARGAFSTFVWTVVRNALADFGARETVDPELFEDLDEVDEMHHPEHYLDVDGILLYTDLEEHLRLEELEVIEMLVYQDASLEQVADVLSMSRQTVAKYRDSGIERLRRAYGVA